MVQVFPFQRVPIGKALPNPHMLHGGCVCKLFHTEVEMHVCSSRCTVSLSLHRVSLTAEYPMLLVCVGSDCV